MTQQLTLEIGGSRLCFRGHRSLRIQPPAWGYPDFIAAAPPSSAPRADIDITVRTGAPPGGEPMDTCFDTGDSWRLSSKGDKRRIELVPRQGNSAPHWCADTDVHYAQVRLYCADSLLETDAVGVQVRHLVQYPLDQILLVQHLLGARKGLLLHAAGAVREVGSGAHGIIFAGASGAGKSTLTRQLTTCPGWRFLSDDRIVLRLQSNRVDMYGTPWPGDAQVALNQCAPLKTLCFLCQSDQSRLEPISSARALDRLLPVTSIAWFDRALLNNALDLCAQLLADVPVYELHFQRRDPRLAAMLESLPA